MSAKFQAPRGTHDVLPAEERWWSLVRTIEEVQTSENIWWDMEGSSGVFFQEFFSRNTLTGIQGDPTVATAEKGQQLFAAATRRLAAFLEEFRQREIRPRHDLHT